MGETLTAKVDDADGVPANVTYQWLANGVAITGATGSSYQLTANDAGKTISVRATYTDNANHSEAPTSAATTPVVDPANRSRHNRSRTTKAPSPFLARRKWAKP